MNHASAVLQTCARARVVFEQRLSTEHRQALPPPARAQVQLAQRLERRSILGEVGERPVPPRLRALRVLHPLEVHLAGLSTELGQHQRRGDDLDHLLQSLEQRSPPLRRAAQPLEALERSELGGVELHDLLEGVIRVQALIALLPVIGHLVVQLDRLGALEVLSQSPLVGAQQLGWSVELQREALQRAKGRTRVGAQLQGVEVGGHRGDRVLQLMLLQLGDLELHLGPPVTRRSQRPQAGQRLSRVGPCVMTAVQVNQQARVSRARSCLEQAPERNGRLLWALQLGLFEYRELFEELDAGALLGRDLEGELDRLDLTLVQPATLEQTHQRAERCLVRRVVRQDRIERSLGGVDQVEVQVLNRGERQGEAREVWAEGEPRERLGVRSCQLAHQLQ